MALRKESAMKAHAVSRMFPPAVCRVRAATTPKEEQTARQALEETAGMRRRQPCRASPPSPRNVAHETVPDGTSAPQRLVQTRTNHSFKRQNKKRNC